MSHDVPWLGYRGKLLHVVCPVCGNDSCHVQTVSVCQNGLDVAIARRHVLSREGSQTNAEYRVELRLFCSRGHRFAVQFAGNGDATRVNIQAIPAAVGLPLLELER